MTTLLSENGRLPRCCQGQTTCRNGQFRMWPMISLRSMKREPKRGMPSFFDWRKYRQRNINEHPDGRKEVKA